MEAKVANIDDIKSREIILKYPTEWEYKVVVEKNINIKDILDPILKDRIYKLKPSKTSKEGNYNSYSVSVVVHNDEDRVFLYETIKAQDSVKIVL